MQKPRLTAFIRTWALKANWLVYGTKSLILMQNKSCQTRNSATFADCLTMLRFRNRIKRDLGLDISAEQLLEAGTLKVLVARLYSQTTTSTVADLNIYRDEPPQMDDMASTLGDFDVSCHVCQQPLVSVSIVEIPQVENPKELVSLIHKGTHFSKPNNPILLS